MSGNAKTVRFKVLVVDDHASAREAVAEVLRQAGYDVAACASATEALARLTRERTDVVVTDLQMPGIDGLQFIREIERRRLPVEALMITAHASVASAVEAIRHGAFDYLEKPFDATQLEESVARACERRRLFEADGHPHSEASKCNPHRTTSQHSTEHDSVAPAMIGSSPAMQDLRQRIAQVAASDETALICGESGTGKELVARTLHALSRRCRGPLVSLNCPVLSAQLTESELFGHKRGAFTGADADRTGRFELAHGGSILLDEVTEIDLALQAKLLRILQERTFERVGSSETVRVDVRVLATTNRDLPTEITAGRFREDLYFRLAVVPIAVPPLRERPGDIHELADHFLDAATQRLEQRKFQLEPAARQLLDEYHWPGNVRELHNVITRACVLSTDNLIRAALIRPWLSASDRDTGRRQENLDVTLDELERRTILATLERCGGHRAKAAETLGIGIRTLSGKLRSYGIAPREKNIAKAS